mgnify:CR=1 FL=1|tara:strand:+ start:151 stop:651 length:501 start_codon:yes stop_codon:yes gene_type:complete
MEPYYKLVPNAISKETKQKLLDIALAPDSFVDISYKISFFKLPSTLQKFNTTGLSCVCQMLKVNESDSVIHKDKNRVNEFDGTYIPRQTVVSFSLTENSGITHFYNDNKMFLCEADYEGYGAILNTGEYYHNVYFTKDNETRIVFQLCFEETFEQVCKIYNEEIII